MNEKYNGWSNYATWRVNLEIVSSYDFEADMDDGTDFNTISDLADYIKDNVQSAIESDGTASGLVYDYAVAFLADVNWYEIAEAVASDYPELIEKD